MITQTDLFAPATEIIGSEEISQELNKALAVTTPIAVPCGFRDRPMVHCDAACFNGEAPARQYGTDDHDILWDDRTGPYGDE